MTHWIYYEWPEVTRVITITTNDIFQYLIATELALTLCVFCCRILYYNQANQFQRRKNIWHRILLLVKKVYANRHRLMLHMTKSYANKHTLLLRVTKSYALTFGTCDKILCLMALTFSTCDNILCLMALTFSTCDKILCLSNGIDFQHMWQIPMPIGIDFFTCDKILRLFFFFC